MHYDVKFQGSQYDKDEQALQEVISWLGEERAEEIAEILAFSIVKSFKEFRFAVSLTGISGYPVYALARAFQPGLNVED